MSGFQYLEISLELDGQKISNVKKETFKDCILFGLESVFGEFATCIPIDIVDYDIWSGRGVLRCPNSFCTKFRAALTLTGEFKNRRCCFNVRRVSKTNWLIPEGGESEES